MDIYYMYCGNHFTACTYIKSLVFYTLNLSNVTYKLHLKKTNKQKSEY